MIPKDGRQENLPLTDSGYQMIRTIKVQNFRCYPSLVVDDVRRLNFIVGDNGSGKTALLEAVFLALATGTEVAARLRAQRGMDGSFAGTPMKLQRHIFGDFFTNGSVSHPLSVVLTGDGEVNRSLVVQRTVAHVQVTPEGALETHGPVSFTWTDHNGISRVAIPVFSQAGVSLPDTGEETPFLFFSASQMVGATENAIRFSELVLSGGRGRVLTAMSEIFPALESMGIEAFAGNVALYATVDGRRTPLSSISGGINRFSAILMGLASLPGGAVLIDEIDSGLYYNRQEQMCRHLLGIARETKSQIIASTHSKEFLNAVVSAAGDDTSDIALWRVQKNADGTSTVTQFSGDVLRAGIEYDEEIRGH